MRPIKQSILPNTVTIYNHYRDSDSGKMAYYAANIKYTRIMTIEKTVNSDATGWTKALFLNLWIDPISSFAYSLDENGNKVKKIYAEPSQWANMSVTDKEKHWTLQPQDLVVDKETNFALTPDNQEEFMEQYKPQAINTINPVLDKPGNVHHWEINLV